MGPWLEEEGLTELLNGSFRECLAFMASDSCRHNFGPAILVRWITAALIDPRHVMPQEASAASTNSCGLLGKALFAEQT